MLDASEYARWIKSARRTLDSAGGDLDRGDYNWSCFKAHQAAEFAVKALLHGLGLQALGHSVSGLLAKAPADLGFQEVIEEAKTLDKYYVPTRYPNAWAGGTPEEYYTRLDAENAIKSAGRVIEKVEVSWRSLKREGG